jgi:single-strand DNA-binding protein
MRNTCFVIGNIGSDPVERARSEKTGPIVGFSVAENVQTYDKETRQYKTLHTNWFNVTVFGNLAERTKNNVRKGDRVAVQGRMKVSKFTDKTGQDRTSFEIIAEEIAHWQTLPSAGAGGDSADETSRSDRSRAQRGGYYPTAAEDDSLPF